MSMIGKRSLGGDTQGAGALSAAARNERRKLALKSNMARRKAQVRGREADGEESGSRTDDAPEKDRN